MSKDGGYASEREEHRDAIRRDRLLGELDRWLLGDDDHWVVVVAGPGTGKTALMVQWLERREAAGTLVPYHFIRRNDPGRADPARIVAALAEQVEAIYPAQRDPGAAPDSRLTELLERISARELVPRGKRLVLLLDGLDECDALGVADDPLAAFLPRALPHVRMLCASRPNYACMSSLEARGRDVIRIDLDAPAYDDDNAITVRKFWEREAPKLGLDAQFVEDAIAAADHNIQHAVMLKRYLASVPTEQRRVETVPRGLTALLGVIWRRMMKQPAAVDGLGVLCAAREPLSLDQIGRVAGWEGIAQRQAFKDTASELLIGTRREDGTSEYRLHHAAIREHIINEIGGEELRWHHASLSRTLAAWPPLAEPAARRYALRHALAHRAEAGDAAGVRDIAGDVEFLEAKCREFGVDDVEADLARAADRCRGDAAVSRALTEFARAVARESHWIRGDGGALAAQLWNRLRRMGWTVAEIDGWLRIPARSREFLRVRRAVSRESRELVRDLVPQTAALSACVAMRDGRHVASASLDGMIRIWEIATMRVIATLDGRGRSPASCAVSPDRGWVASATVEHTIEVRRVDGSVTRLLTGHRDAVKSCAFTPDGQHLISVSDDQTLRIWRVPSFELVAMLGGHTGPVNCCAVALDSSTVVSASADRTLRIWRIPSGERVRTLEGHRDGVVSCAIADGHVVSSSYDKTLRVWDLASDARVRTLEGHADWVTSCAVTTDGRVVSASHDHTLRVWHLASGELLRTLEGHADWVTSCAVTADGRLVASASADRTVKLWDIRTVVARASGHREPGTGDAFWISAPAPPIPAAYDGDTTPKGHLGRVRSCTIIPERRCVVSASDDRTLRTWNLNSGESIATYSGHASPVTDCAALPGGHRVVSASFDQTLKVWDLDALHDNREVNTFASQSRVTCCVAMSDGQRVVCAYDDGHIEVRRVDTGLSVPLGKHAGRVNRCAVTHNSKRVISASDDRTLKIWELDTGRVVSTLEGHADDVMGCAVDSRHVVSASDDKTLMVWTFDGQPLGTLTGHAAWVRGCAIAPDGRHAISVSADATLKIWDLTTYKCVATHRGEQQFSAVTATDTTICAGDAAGTLWFLDWPPSLLPAPLPPQVPPDTRSITGKQVVLFCEANPIMTPRLGLDEELRAVLHKIDAATYRDEFDLVPALAVTVGDLISRLRREQPSIVHFSGHGGLGVAPIPGGATTARDVRPAAGDEAYGKGAICMSDGRGGEEWVSGAALREMIETTTGSLRLVVLNACYSDALGDELRSVVDCVIGMTGPINDGPAQRFATEFYAALGDGVSIGEAFEQARGALVNPADKQRLQHRTRDGVDSRKLFLAGPKRP